jgi:ABC-type glutathione transport system ATPase component
MYAGQVMEQQRVEALFAEPQHPYTEALLAALPEQGEAATGSPPFPAWCPACSTAPRLPVRAALRLRHRAFAGVRPELRAWQGGQVRCHYPLGDPGAAVPDRARPAAGRGVRRMRRSSSKRRTCARSTRSAAACSASRRSCRRWAASPSRWKRARTLAVVGESGCGKSTLARMVALIEKPTDGTLMLDGTDAVNPPASERRRLRQAVQLVFQNPYGSLNPRKKISAVLEAPLAINTDLKAGRARRARPRDAGAGGPAARVRQPLPAHVLRRPAPAHRDRRGADARARSWWWRTSRCRRSTCRSRPRC